MPPERNSASPPTDAAPNPAPWKESQKLTVLNRPVARRAILSAISTASEPPGASKTFQGPPGTMADNLSASLTAGSQVKRRGAKGRERIWRSTSARTLG